jgi:hypothetical protein
MSLSSDPLESIGKEKANQILHQLCKDERLLLSDARLLRMFNVFLMRFDLGVHIPVEVGILSLIIETRF